MRRVTLLMGAALFALAGCGGGGDIKSACSAMMKSAVKADPDGAPSKEEQKKFCGCLSDGTEDMKGKDKKAIAKLLKDADEDMDMESELQKMVDDGKLSEEGVEEFMGSMKQCSMQMM